MQQYLALQIQIMKIEFILYNYFVAQIILINHLLLNSFQK